MQLLCHTWFRSLCFCVSVTQQWWGRALWCCGRWECHSSAELPLLLLPASVTLGQTSVCVTGDGWEHGVSGTALAARLWLRGCWASAEMLILPVLNSHRDPATLLGFSNAIYISILELNQHFSEEVKFCLLKMKSAVLLPTTVVPSCCLKNNETPAYWRVKHIAGECVISLICDCIVPQSAASCN